MNPTDLKVLSPGRIVAGGTAHFHANVVVQPQCVVLWPCIVQQMKRP